MNTPLTLSLWFGVALYAVIGLFGVVAFHDGGPSPQTQNSGYGVAYSALASSDMGK